MKRTTKTASASAGEHDALLETLKTRFEQNTSRHPGVAWADVRAKLAASPDKLRALAEMERTGGEPDVIAFDKKRNEYHFVDCSAESPAGRRSLCYDRAGLESRKEARPVSSAIDVANEMGVELLDEDQYRALQAVGRFDVKTSSWLLTPDPIRRLGGAIFGDWRYGRTFIYHNGAQSYYAARGFRAILRV
jgi:hypothetical protein